MGYHHWAAAMAARHKLIIFDVDGTLVRPHHGLFRAQGHPEDWACVAPRDEQVRALHSAGVTCALASNQGGVAFGLFDAAEMRAELVRLGTMLHIRPDMVFACFMHPKGTVAAFRGESPDRKPGPGMLLDAMKTYRATIGPLTDTECLMVGDRPEDAQAAAAAQIDFCDADQFFRMEDVSFAANSS